jgi:Co/Zn/Cd efflux system component
VSHTATCHLDPAHTHAGHADDEHEHGGQAHSHGLVDPSITRSREGLRAVGFSLAILAVTAIAQAVIYVSTGSVALLADLIHNFGDALTAFPLGIAFILRSAHAERQAGLAVVFAIFVSACIAAGVAIDRLIHPLAPTHLLALTLAGLIGFIGNAAAARVRIRAGRRLESPALIADGLHARTDAIVSLGVVATAAVVGARLSHRRSDHRPRHHRHHPPHHLGKLAHRALIEARLDRREDLRKKPRYGLIVAKHQAVPRTLSTSRRRPLYALVTSREQ